MNASNELKVGVAIILSVIAFVLGIRFFEDIPLFKGTYDLYTVYDDARGMIVGNAVRISGVDVGSVQEVDLDPETNKVKIRLRLDTRFVVTKGAYTEITGIDALNAVQMVIHPGPVDAARVEDGDFLPSRVASDLFTSLTESAPSLLNRGDSLLLGLGGTLTDIRGVIEPGGDLRMMIASLRSSADAVETLLREERARISSVIANVDTLTLQLGQTTQGAGDSLAIATQNLNEMLRTLDRNLASIEETTTTLDGIVDRIDRGEGTVGKLINDPTLYHRMDSTLQNMNRLVVDIQENPVRYMRALRLVDIF